MAAQSYVGTKTSPSCVPTSCGTFTLADWSTTLAMSSRQLTRVRRKRCLTKPKYQSGENFVWPTIKNDRLIFACRPTIVRQNKYCNMVLFLFWPTQLSACRWTSLSPRPCTSKKWCSRLTIVFAPFLVSHASSIKYMI